MEYINNCLRCVSYKKEVAANEDRFVYANRPEINKTFHFRDNRIHTSKYNIVTFLPINLFEQMTRAANLYFLLQIVIMAIPAITALNPLSTAVPLLLIMLVTMIKDGYDDLGRHRSDNRLNNQVACVIDHKGNEKLTKWQNVKTGDMIKVRNDEPVSADILVLSTSDESGLCFIETADLDGETNLKVRQPLVDTALFFEEEKHYEKFDGKVTCEPPNNRLDRFQGNLDWKGETYSLDNSNVILRGCVLRNTPFVYGLVIYAGHESKLMMNSGKRVFKRTKLDRFTNTLIIWIAALLALICAFLSLMSYFWEKDFGKKWLYILPWETFFNDDPGLIALINWPGFIMVLNTLIPISLYISVEIIRLCQSLLINWDLKIYHPETDTPAAARNTTLTEELGQIQYIFSDKTGTLTQNVMLFKECSINGIVYGHLEEDETNPADGLDCVDFRFNKYADRNFKFCDQSLVDSIRNNEEDCVEFFCLLALCHTVMVEEKDTDDLDTTDYIPCDGYERPVLLDYQAQSPDEGALVSAARNFGVIFKKRTPNSVIIEVNGVEETYELLSCLDFDNVRKRMSVIVKSNGKIILYCKGADTIMFELLTDAKPEIQEKTSKDLDTFAQSGLRTLLLAYKEISQEEYDKWNVLLDEASTAMTDRDDKVMEAYNMIEKDLILLGATAIEDKLQDGVPATIAALADANINLWVLTGDKQETAINIGYSSMLLTEDMVDIFIIDGENEQDVERQIRQFLEKADTSTLNSNNCNSTLPSVKVSCPVEMDLRESGGSVSDVVGKGYGLVIPGKSLAFALTDELELKFLELAKLCKAVICCRVTPLQKALVVELVKRNVKATTLAIGDGANDVSMIKAAHIGVGISGKEGRQAVLAADYSFAQFRFLERLLLVHGRWSYLRMSKFLNYFFYKNFAFTLVQFWFNLFSGFSAQTLYDDWYISVYNVCFTSLPVLAMGIFDQDVSDERCVLYPKLYIPGQQNILFNKKTILLKLIHGTVTSCVMFFIPYGIYQDVYSSDGIVHSDLTFFGVAVGAILVITVNLQVALDTTHWTWINHLFIWGSIIFYFIYTFTIYSETLYNYLPDQFSDVGDAIGTFGYSNFWAALFLTVTVCIPTNMGYRWVKQKTRPTLSDKIRRGLMRKPPLFSLTARRRKAALSRKRPQSTRSAYAFSQEKGFGALLLKGRWMNRLKMKTKSSSYDLNKLTSERSKNANSVERSKIAQNCRNDVQLQDIDYESLTSLKTTSSNSRMTVL